MTDNLDELADLPEVTIDAELSAQIAAELAAVDVDAMSAELEELAALLGPMPEISLDDLPEIDLD